LWYPDVLTNATYSTFALGDELKKVSPASESAVRSLLSSGLGISDPTEEEIKLLQEQNDNVWALDKTLAGMVSKRAQVGWSTHGHSGVDVSLYAYGYNSTNLKGSVENTAIGQFVATVMDIDLDQMTFLLGRTAKAWHNKVPTDAALDSNHTIGVVHYHGNDALSHGSEHLYLDGPQSFQI